MIERQLLQMISKSIHNPMFVSLVLQSYETWWECYAYTRMDFKANIISL